METTLNDCLMLDELREEEVSTICQIIMTQLKTLPNDSVILHEILAFADECLCNVEHPPVPTSGD